MKDLQALASASKWNTVMWALQVPAAKGSKQGDLLVGSSAGATSSVFSSISAGRRRAEI